MVDGVAIRARASLGLVFFLAWKTLGENRVSLVLLLLAVAAGVAFQVPNRANLAGYRAELMDQEVLSGMGHVRVRPRRGDRFREAEEMIARIRQIRDVESVEPILSLPGAISKGGKFVVLGIVGVNTTGRHRPYERTSGTDLAPEDKHGTILGERLARNLGVGVGDDVDIQVLLSNHPRLVLDDNGVGTYTLSVRGIVGAAATDSLFVNWAFLASETGEAGSATALIVHATNTSLAASRRIAAAIETMFPAATAKSWLDDSRYVRSAVQAIEAVGGIAGVMSLVGVSIPVLALLYIDALNRRRQVSLLCAIGFRDPEIFLIFLVKALMIGIVGVTVGAIFGWGIVRYFDLRPIYTYEKFVIRPLLDPVNLLWPMLMVLATTVLAGSVPAWQVARINPSDTLRRIE